MGSKTLAIATILCIMLGPSLVYVAAYNICGGELTFTAEGEFEWILIKYPGASYDLGYIYEDGGSCSYSLGLAPKFDVLQVVVYTSDGNYFDFVHCVPVGSETIEVGGVQVTIESGYENIGTINPFEWAMVVLLGLLLGMILLSIIILVLESKGIHL
jgi:hypothetical protein